MKIFLPMWIANVATLLAGDAIDTILAFIIMSVAIGAFFVLCIVYFSEKRPLELAIKTNIRNGAMSVVYHFKNKTKNRIWVSYHVIKVMHGGKLQISKGYERSWVLEPGKEKQVFESERRTPDQWKIREKGEYHIFSYVTYNHEGVDKIISGDCGFYWPLRR